VKRRLLAAFASLLAGAALLAPARALTPLPTLADTEINHLLAFVATSGCEFNRNGTWYDQKQAEAHLRFKYQALISDHGVVTADDFIDHAASVSSLSGRPYQVRCENREVILCSLWLRGELARYRAASSTSRAGRDVL
jgi:hypothetical protein